MPLGKPTTMQEASAELRQKAARLRTEMEPPSDPFAPDGKGFPVKLLLIFALLDAVNDEYDERMRNAPEEQRPIYERALQLARHKHNLCLADNCERLVTNGSPGQIPVYATVPKRRGWLGDRYEDSHVLALQTNLYDLKPLWAQYLWEADIQIKEEAEAKAAENV